VGSVALCFYFPDRCADGGNTEARRKKEGEGEGEGEAGKGNGDGAKGGSLWSLWLFVSIWGEDTVSVKSLAIRNVLALI
jgi:hypothetical protein